MRQLLLLIQQSLEEALSEQVQLPQIVMAVLRLINGKVVLV